MTGNRGRPRTLDNPFCPAPSEIRAARLEAGLSQAEAAALTSASTKTWRRWETGITGMNPAIWREWLVSVSEPEIRPQLLPPRSDEIRAARLAAKLTQEGAAIIAQVGTETWANWETGRATMHGAAWVVWNKSVRVVLSGWSDKP